MMKYVLPSLFSLNNIATKIHREGTDNFCMTVVLNVQQRFIHCLCFVLVLDVILS